MKFIKQKIEEVFLIEPEPYEDDRGLYRRHFCQKEFKNNGLDFIVAQANISENKFAYTLRGFHFQKAPFAEAKTLSCIKGSVFDIVVDLRKKSKTYKKWLGFELSEENRKAIHIPKGCAHAILTLEDNTWIHYYSSQFYHPEAEAGIRYNDKSFGFKWPVEPKIISEKDLNHPDFAA